MFCLCVVHVRVVVCVWVRRIGVFDVLCVLYMCVLYWCIRLLWCMGWCLCVCCVCGLVLSRTYHVCVVWILCVMCGCMRSVVVCYVGAFVQGSGCVV